MSSLLRTFVTLALAFLLLSLQHEAAVHALEHRADRHEQRVTTPQKGEPCAKCELLASGADGIPATGAPSGAGCASSPVAQVAFTSRAVTAPSCYSSRAPPVPV
jgi:hypothetical protein